MSKITADTTLLEILKGGGSATLFNDEIQLKGDPSTGYIDIRSSDLEGGFKSEGLWSLDREGVQDALNDAAEIVSGLHDG